MTRAMRTLAALTLAAGAAAQGAVWIVDPANGPGAHFTSLQQAASSAQVAPGDVLALQPGDVGPLTTSKPLVVVGTPLSTIGQVYLTAIPAGSEFVLHGCRVPSQTFTGLAFIEVWGCPGRVVVADLVYRAPTGPPQFTMQRLLLAADCPDLEVRGITSIGLSMVIGRCRATVRDCRLQENYVNPPISGTDALVVHDSELDVVDSSLQGSNGGLYTGIGLRARDALVRVRATAPGRTTLLGGPTLGGYGTALDVRRGRVELDPLVSVGTVVNQGGTIVTRSMPSVTASYASGLAAASMSGRVGDPAILGFGLLRAPIRIAAGAPLRLDLAAGMAGVVAGVIPGSGAMSTAVAVPNAPALLGRSFVAQGATSSQGVVEIANGAAILVR